MKSKANPLKKDFKNTKNKERKHPFLSDIKERHYYRSH